MLVEQSAFLSFKLKALLASQRLVFECDLNFDQLTSGITGLFESLRELVMSYFEHYYNLRREKSLRNYSRPVRLSRFDYAIFKTHVGALEDNSSVTYLRPETAQGIFVNFLNVQQATRQKVPFGIAQVGKAFRNEITPGNFTFRTREFEQMEMQFFVEPGTDMEWFEKWKAWRREWHLGLGLADDRLQFHQHGEKELAHYARAAFDIEFDFGGTLGFQEIEGVHNRSDFALKQHQEYSGKRLEYVDQAANKRYLPYVIETSVGADRVVVAHLATGQEWQ